MPGRNCGNCGKQLDPDEGVGTLPGKPNILLCRPCYKSITNPN